MLRLVTWIVRHLDDLISGAAMAVALWILCQEMVVRWLFNMSFTWSEDLSRVLLVVMVYFGASAVASENRHIRVEFLLDMLPGRVRKAFCLAIDIACFAFSVTAVWLGLRLVRDTASLGLAFAHSGFAMPVWVAQSCIPAAFTLMSLRIGWRILTGKTDRTVLAADGQEG